MTGSATRRGFVYFAEFAGRVKVGFTVDLEKRLLALRKQCRHTPILLKAFPATMSAEHAVHRLLRQHRVAGREWYSTEVLPLVAALDELSFAALVRPKPTPRELGFQTPPTRVEWQAVRARVEAAVQEDRYRDLTSRALASALGCSHSLIIDVRRKLGLTDGTRSGADGKRYRAAWRSS